MDGYRLTPCQTTRFCCLSLLVLLLNLPALAQDVTTRGEDAFSTDDGTLIVHVAVPRGQIIQEGRLSHSDLAEAVILRPDPEPLREVRWFILDASGEMLNAAPFVKDAIQRFIRADDLRVSYGVIVFDSRARLLVSPTRDTAALIRALDSYSGTVGQVGCVGDALVELRSLRSPDQARRVLLVVGPLTRQGTCNETPVQSASVPIDIIVVADDVDGAYLDIAERSQGVVRRANLRTISARFDEVKTQWLQPIYALRGRSPQPIGGQSSLRVQFTDSTSAAALVRVSRIQLTPTPLGPSLQRPPTATPSPTDPPTPTAFVAPTFTALPVVAQQPSPTLTPIVAVLAPTETPFVLSLPGAMPSFTPLPIGQPLNQPTSALPRPVRVTFTPRPTDTPAPSDTPTPLVLSATPTSERASSAQALPSATPAPSSTPAPSATPVSLAVVSTQAEAAPADDPAPPDDDQSPNAQESNAPQDVLASLIAALTATNPLILTGGGLALLAVLIGLVSLLSMGRQRRRALVQRTSSQSDDTTLDPGLKGGQTILDPALMQPTSNAALDFYGGIVKPPSKEELRRQAQSRPYADGAPTPHLAPSPALRPVQDHFDEDSLILTSVLSDGDFQHMQAQSGGEVVAWLRLDSRPPRDYELRAAGLSIGRKADNDIVVTGDSAISGQHARLEVDSDGRVTLVVLSQTNPVVINGVMLRKDERRVLRPQNVIQLSPNTRLIFIARDGEQSNFDEEMTQL
ncbi:MAG: FHA domain-containing protein [Anaerolineae bacterium]|nr:FHA domain-containing protein [Anaerolineae bacterium]MDW8171744.1 FHA domain-containing protein [Anaerolineae bacterium]